MSISGFKLGWPMMLLARLEGRHASLRILFIEAKLVFKAKIGVFKNETCMEEGMQGSKLTVCGARPSRGVGG
ncbi:hypothetical protein COLO4_23916 [Corchorus olitorius]|uniref:Uncharacterized protein n=1 Tax=Corchorus olitorius TaxID=93759 RepID=A0A1R3IE23_9ROSI|nr:hypothetical protein COLO4_23916 [Corchorus olitorius]